MGMYEVPGKILLFPQHQKLISLDVGKHSNTTRQQLIIAESIEVRMHQEPIFNFTPKLLKAAKINSHFISLPVTRLSGSDFFVLYI